MPVVAARAASVDVDPLISTGAGCVMPIPSHPASAANGMPEMAALKWQWGSQDAGICPS